MNVDLYIADHFETLASGKILAVGLYTDRTVVLNPPPGAPAPSAETPYMLDLGLLLTMTDTAGATDDWQLVLKGPDGEPLRPALPLSPITMQPGQSHNLIVSLRPLTVRSAGRYVTELTGGGQTLQAGFTVLWQPQASAVAPEAPSASTAGQGQPKRRRKSKAAAETT